MIGHPPSSVFWRFCCHHCGPSGPGCASDFHALLRHPGITLKPGKSQVGGSVVFPGLLGGFPCSAGDHLMSISVPPEKRDQWSQLLDLYLKEGAIPHIYLDKLIGRLAFPQTALFGKFPRTHMRPLYQKLRSMFYCATLSDREKLLFGWTLQVISEFPPPPYRRSPTAPPSLDFIYRRSYFAALSLCSSFSLGHAVARPSGLCVEYRCRALVLSFSPYRVDFWFGTAGPCGFFENWAPFLSGSCVWAYLGNNNFLSALTR